MSHVFPRNCHAIYPVIASGEGCYLTDQDGKRYFDGSGGAAVSSLGHGNRAIIQAIKEQLDKIAFAHSGFFTSEPAEALADFLISRAPDKLERVYFVSGGSEAVEAALKLARQYFLERGEVKRHRVIGRKQSYHGNTLGALATGGNQWRREPFSPLMIETSHISPCFAYRGKGEDESEAEYGLRVADELEREIERLGPETVMAFVAETVVGATLGAVPAVEGYFKRIRKICDSHGILLILDEVMCGMGRTGTLFAFEQEGVEPDIVTIAKGLGGGYQPIGATLCTQEIYKTIEAGSGFFQHGHTYQAHPTACAAGLAVMEEIEKQGLLNNVTLQGDALKKSLEETFGQHPHVGDIRGRGLFIGMELVEERNEKKPFDPAMKLNAKIKKHAFEAGLICYPMGGTIDGRFGDHVLLAPPFIMQEQHVDEIVSKLEVALRHSLDSA